MSVWAVVVLWVVGVWLAGALFTAGLLWEREHLLENVDVGSWRWWGAYLFSSAWWLPVLVLWGISRPAPPQPAPGDGYLGAVSEGVYIPPMPEGWEGDWERGPGRVMQVPPSRPPTLLDFTEREIREMPREVYNDLRFAGPEHTPGIRWADSWKTLRQQVSFEGSLAALADTPGKLYQFVGGEWRVRYDSACQRCQVDRHQCPGCGEPLAHWRGACGDCDKEGS